MDEDTKITSYLEKSGFIDVLIATCYKNHTHWKDIMIHIVKTRNSFSSSTIKERLNELVKLNLIKKIIKIKSRNEYTYHATALGKRYAKVISTMIRQLEDESLVPLAISSETLDLLVQETIKHGYDSPAALINELLRLVKKKQVKK